MESPPPGIEPTSLLSPVLAGGFLERQVGKIELRTGKELLKNTFDILCLRCFISEDRKRPISIEIIGSLKIKHEFMF